MYSTWKRSGKMIERNQMTSVLISTITRPYETKIRGRSTSCTSGLMNVVRSPKTALMMSHERMG